MDAPVNQQLAELGTAPISAAQPCGQSARYEPEFEQLEAELAKQESLTPSAVDWGRVVELATVILQTKSKDLLVAAYLCRGLMETQRYAGLATGLQILRDLSQKHWDGLFPELKRMRARATAVSWLAEKTGKQVRDTRPKSGEKDAVSLAAALLKELDQALVEKMGQDAPALTDLSRPLKDHLQNLEAPPAAPKAAAAPTAARPAAAPVEVAEVLNDADAKKVLRQMQELARKVTKYWLSKDVTDARAYRLGRSAGWLTVESAPVNTDGQTQIPGPAPEKLKQFETQRQAGQLEALLPELESTLAKAPYWLDGQKLAADVLESMGERGAAARKTVLRELANFNAAVPGLAELKFLGGKPFAEELTRDWMAEQASGAAQPSGGKRAKREVEPWEEAFNNARATATAGNLDGAVKQLTDGFNATASAHEQFMWRLALAQLLVQIGHANVAAPLLESLTARIEEFRLKEWEPELAVRVYKLLLTAYDKSTGKAKNAPEVAARAAHAFSALSSLDPAIALNVKL
ncbi:MAG TPA: type VI secretion system protein TssA [Gammaproteobacteria bacterium]